MKLGTPLSNFEANLNYKEIDDPSVTVAFEWAGEQGTYFLAWTTTPWTLPSNLALMVGKDHEYVKVLDAETGRKYVLASERLASNFKAEAKVLEHFKGFQLEGKRYKPLFPFFAEREDSFRVILEDAVSLEDGTGIVHCAPAFGEVDFFACKREGIELVCPVDANGCFTSEVEELLSDDAARNALPDELHRVFVRDKLSDFLVILTHGFDDGGDGGFEPRELIFNLALFYLRRLRIIAR